MSTVYNWDPFFQAINSATTQWGQRNQVNGMIDSLTGAQPAPNTGFAGQDARLQAASPAPSGPLAGMNLQMLRNAPPQISMPLLLQLATREHKYSQTPQYDQQGNAFVLDDQGNMKPLAGVKARDKNEFINGQAVNPYNTPAGTIIPKQEATPDSIQIAQSLFPNDPKAQHDYLVKNSPANLRAITNINNPHQNWQILTDPKTNTQYRYDIDSGKAFTLDGQPYTPAGAAKITGGASARSPGMAFMNKYITEHPGATSDEISTAAQKFRMGQSEAGTVGTRAGAADVASLEVSAFAKQALDANNNLPRADWEITNSALQAWDTKTQNPQLRRLMIAADALVNARARAISPTGSPHVNDQLEGRKMLSSAFASGDFAAAVDQMEMEAEGVRTSTQSSKDAVLNPGNHKPDAAPKPQSAPAPSQTKTIGGVTYHLVNGQWMH